MKALLATGKHNDHHHRLRGSASPVLTATGFVNGKWQFWPSPPPQNRHTSTDRQNICHGWLSRRPLRLCQMRCISIHGGLLQGKWVKYNQNYFYLCPFLRNSPTGQTRRRIFTHDGSNDAHSRKGVPFWGFFHIAPHLGGQKTQFLGMNIFVFKPNSRYRKTCILSKLLHRFQPNFAQ